MFLELIFRDNFFYLRAVFAKCVYDDSCKGDFLPTSAKGLLHVTQTDFVYLDEDFGIN